MAGELAHRETARGRLPGAAVVPISKPQLVTVAIVRNNATVITGKVGDVVVEIMLDTGSAVSLLHCRETNSMNTQPLSQGCSSIQLITTYYQLCQNTCTNDR